VLLRFWEESRYLCFIWLSFVFSTYICWKTTCYFSKEIWTSISL